MRLPPTPLARYGVAVAVTAVAVLARRLLDPVLADRFPFALPFLAVLVSAGYGGFGPGLLSTVAGGAWSGILWFSGSLGTDPNKQWGLPLYAAVSLGICWIGARMRRAQLTAKREAEQKDLQHEQLRVTLASIGDAVVTTDVDGRITSMNPVAEHLTGWNAGAAIGTPLLDVLVLLNEDTRARVTPPAVAALEQGVIVGLANHTVLVAADGTERPIDDSAAPIKSSTGSTVGAVLVFRDASDRRRSELARQYLQRQREDLFDNASVGIHMVGPDGTVLNVNRCELDLLGYAREDYVGHHISEFHADREVIDDILARLAAGEIIKSRIAKMRCKSGEEKHVQIDSSVYWEDGRFVHTRCFTADVTAQVRAQEALRENERNKDEFIALLAHELRNPLAPIHAATQVVRLRSSPDPQLRWAREVIERQMRVMTRLVDDLMDVSRLHRGKIHLINERVALSVIVERALETARPLFEERRQRIEVTQEDEPIWLHADATRLEQVLANLLNNAAKYTPRDGHIALDVRADERTACVTVRDDGIGMDASFLPRAFEMFAQARRDTENGQGGLGIGLALVRRLVELHGGSIHAQSAGLNRGSEFSIRLPRLAAGASVPAGAGRAPGPAPEAHPAEIPAGEGRDATPAALRRVLVVDDNVDAAQCLAVYLRLSGHSAVVAGNAEEAVSVFRDTHPDVIFMDIGMPVVDGHELARRIRAEPVGNRPVLVALTGWGQESDRARSQESGFDHHLVKPADLSRVEQILRDLS